MTDVTEPSPAPRPRAVGEDHLDAVHLPEGTAMIAAVREQARILLAVWVFQAVYLLTIGAAFVLMLLSIIGMI